MSTESASVPAALMQWVERAMQGQVLSASVLDGGKSRLICALDVECDGGVLPVLVRNETGFGPHSGTQFTLIREAATLRALQGLSAQVPKVYGVADDGKAIIMQRLRGRAMMPADAAERQRAIAGFCRALATLHELDTQSIATPFARADNSRDDGLLDLADYEDSYRRLCIRHDVFERGFDWLRRNAPSPLDRVAVIHGDAGPGNFMHENGEITGLIDWEMTHCGDPHDDLAWIWFRVNVLRQDLEADSYFNAYAQASGLAIDPRRVIYFIVQVILRCTVCCGVRQFHDPTKDDSRPKYLRELLEAALDDGRQWRLAKLPPLPACIG